MLDLYIGWLAVDSRSIVNRHIGRMSIKCRSTNDRHIDRYIGRYVNQGPLYVRVLQPVGSRFPLLNLQAESLV